MMPTEFVWQKNLMQVAQYADSTGQGKAASDAVDECLR